MFVYEKKLQYPVKIKNPNPKLAAVIISQYGGPDGELGASLRYLSQRYSMPYAELKGLLTDIGTEELGHLEMVGTIVHQLTRNLSDAVRIWRFALAILAGAGGLFALTAGGIALLIHLSGLTSLDVSYLAPFSDARARRAVLRPLLVRQKWRDTALHPQDLKNQGDGHAQ